MICLPDFLFFEYVFKQQSRMQQVLKGPKSFHVDDTNFNISYGLRKKLSLPKYFRVFPNPPQNQTLQIASKPHQQNHELPIPYQMSRTFLKYMLFYRIVAYLTFISIVLSIISVYGGPHEHILILTNNGITISILIGISIKLKFYTKHLVAKREDITTFSILHIILEILINLPHPTIWTHQYNNFLHLLLMFRIFVIFKYLIESSIYCNMRAYRIININGLNASEHFLFAVKSLVQSLNFAQILTIQLLSVLFFTHCLFLVSSGTKEALYEYDLIDCFEIIMVTMPTVGFGQYSVPFLGQKVIIFLTVINGAVLNSFVTLSMLSQLQMNQSQLSSYWLLKKIQTRGIIQKISKKYIQKSFEKIRQRKKDNTFEEKNQINFSFRNEYRLRKSLYNSISYTDINNLFAYFREHIVQFKMKSVQCKNMMSVLLNELQKENTRRKQQS